jgi:hypothetical protein
VREGRIRVGAQLADVRFYRHGWILVWIILFVILVPLNISLANIAYDNTPNVEDFGKFVDPHDNKPEPKWLYIYVYVLFQIAGAISCIFQILYGRFKKYKFAVTILYVGIGGMLCILGEIYGNYHLDKAMARC